MREQCVRVLFVSRHSDCYYRLELAKYGRFKFRTAIKDLLISLSIYIYIADRARNQILFQWRAHLLKSFSSF